MANVLRIFLKSLDATLVFVYCFANKSLNGRIPRARKYTWYHSLTAHHPFWMWLGFLACYNSDNYVTNASKDKELSSNGTVDGPLARESQKRHGCLVAQLPVILPL